VEVVNRQVNGSVVVSRDDNRVALGAGTAQKIIVTLSAPAEGTS
jgi:Fe2+ transport system protein FeoA